MMSISRRNHFGRLGKATHRVAHRINADISRLSASCCVVILTPSLMGQLHRPQHRATKWSGCRGRSV
jgi:hypothetical protein